MDAPTSSWWLEVLRLCRAGDQTAAVELYREKLISSGGFDVPVGLHLKFLDGGGFTQAAALIRHAGLHAGADVSSCALLRGGDLQNAVAEYRELFASGAATTKMVVNYMTCLSRLGAAAELAVVADPEHLFYRGRLIPPEDIPVEQFLSRVAAALRSAKERERNSKHRSGRELDRVHRTHLMDDPAIRELHAAIRTTTAEYMRKVAGAGHLISAWLPKRFDLLSWGMISEGIGYNVPHVHCGHWVSGVVYVEGEDPALSGADDAGLLRIGAGVDGDPGCPGWPDLSVAPVPGTIVLFPSYYTHWTVPLRRPGSTRISVAFNVTPVADVDSAAPVVERVSHQS
jgi:hypothetical protein